MRLRTAAAAAAIVLAGGEAAYAQAAFKTTTELARKCIADDQSPCSQFIAAALEALESARKAHGEASCLGGQPPGDAAVIKRFVRAILADDAHSDAPPSAAIEAIYKRSCGGTN
jgi:hypothetical protein